MAAKKPSAKPAKAKQTVVKKAPAVKEPAKDTAKKAASAKKAPTVAARPKPAAAAPAPRPTPASAHTATKADKPIEPIKPVAAPAPKAATVAASAHGVGVAAHKPASKVSRPAAPVEQNDEESIAAPAPATPVKPTISARPVISNLNTHSQDTDAASDSEDSEGQDLSSVNLLAGPRNVKPYIPRRGEQYMNKEQLEHFRQILNNWKRDLMQEVDRTVLHMKDEAANFPDPNDRATQESEFSLELRTRDRERKLIRKIEEAIKRIEDGSYGYCVETGEEIGIKRLEARPVATLCIEAQERRERRELQYGDRDDRYR
ncbi:RNA polymerase-binding protein DksA [Peristeroidobacter agariperforans]|uniref:RNA polymerase-binding protein DksA n=1 Tax=Peristeroidobacter agariperforans TaxID=268404 RepID=UPI00101B94B8|nr:RNA polymerase-binding protein DksA [Peristeroidobacter agariperforans]